MSPLIYGPVQAAGTFSGSPPSVAAAIATVDALSSRSNQIYPRLEALGAQLAAGIREAAASAGAPLVVNQVGSVLQLFWGVDGPVQTFADAAGDDRSEIANLATRLLDFGIHVPERGLMLLCAAHTSDHVDFAVNAFARALE
jgi:glutamate-1-semialdehyde 2,1-aminomutase